ncbi:beta-propeller fold lactonase family protein [Brachybacterium sp. MASK1Z-5]|uniref:Beta-propeller fold lactonase family protein n=1 Tax=Brachybacterium halotolerans TaxID=2795215 RepID=A0ABS1BFE0_9MICO|nr:beta-propeller fold lactonase family protein [Brachybacterium halotolerans]MBK0332740.1 beta-propeller fold lactonase family protein [Brachybacterium halotolerans]
MSPRNRRSTRLAGLHAETDPRRPAVLPLLTALLCLALVIAVVGLVEHRRGATGGDGGLLGEPSGTPSGPAEGVPTATARVLDGPSSGTRMSDRKRITGDITPKSVVASGHGHVLANNMLYSHSVTLYDAADRSLAATVPDTVDMSALGFPQYPGTSRGAPVEAAWTADGRYAYVSQYQMTGEGHGASGNDDCRNGDATGRSALLRLDVATMSWDQAIEVGRVPKFVALSPDGSLALVSNWCDRTVSVVDLEAAEVTAEIPVDSAPRGIVVLPDNETAYVTAMYADELFRLDIPTGTSELVRETGRKPRHLVLSPDATRVYLTEAGSDRLLELDTASGEVLRETPTGREPRSMDISPDGTALYVVNYYEDSVSKFDVDTFTEIQRQSVGRNPVGVAYEPTTASVWVANYAGSIDVFDDSGQA